MRFYLSSYKIGNEAEKLKELLKNTNGKVAYISNALDFSNDLERRKKSEQGDIDQLNELGLNLEIENIDLRNYFGKEEELEKILAGFGVIWVRGGNLFVLRQAMKLSGFDNIMKKLLAKDILYGGYSAGICVLAPTLKGMEIVDDVSSKPYGEIETVWEGLGIVDYSIVPHYQSDHPESANAEKTVEYMKENNIPFKTLKDGEVIVQ